jgi:hypothetical protein
MMPADERHRVGSPEGLNPFGATMAPDFAQQAPAFGLPPAPMGSPPGGSPGVPQQAPSAPPPGPPPGAPWSDPAAFAATAPPPTAAEHDASRAGAGRSEPPVPEARRSTPPPQAPVAAQASEVDPLAVPADAPRVIAGFLVGYEGSELGIFWTLYQGKNVIGRKGAADGLDVEVDHPTTSSRHAIVHAAARPGRLKLEDPGSTNGTFVNDQKLAKGDYQELKDGDTLRFGGYSVTVKIV